MQPNGYVRVTTGGGQELSWYIVSVLVASLVESEEKQSKGTHKVRIRGPRRKIDRRGWTRVQGEFGFTNSYRL